MLAKAAEGLLAVPADAEPREALGVSAIVGSSPLKDSGPGPAPCWPRPLPAPPWPSDSAQSWAGKLCARPPYARVALAGVTAEVS